MDEKVEVEQWTNIANFLSGKGWLNERSPKFIKAFNEGYEEAWAEIEAGKIKSKDKK